MRGDASFDVSRPTRTGHRPAPLAAGEPSAIASRYRLVGVIGFGPARSPIDGLALIAVDGHPPRVIHVGSVVAGSDVLQAVDAASARLGPRDGAARVVLPLASQGDAPRMPPAIHSPARPDPATAPPGAASSAQELFHKRQQLQFQEEERQNQAMPADHAAPAPAPAPAH